MRRMLILLLLGTWATSAAAADTITVGSKNFSENRLLAEMFARLIEDRSDLTVTRRLGLAGTQICFEALRSGDIDLYPEYTGTGLVSILQQPALGDPVETLNTVRAEFLSQWDLWWMAPLGFENAYELAVPRALAREHDLSTISDLVRMAPQWTAGLGYEFMNRPDGYPGLQELYGLRFKDVRSLQQALKYQAVGEGHVQCLDVYTTDGRLQVYDLVVLDDDKQFFPSYAAAPLVRGATLAQHPEVGTVLQLLSGALDAETMRGLNRRIEDGGESVERVAQDALEALQLIGHAQVTQVTTRGRNLFSYMAANRAELFRLTLQHLGMSALGVGLGVLIAVPLGLFLERRRGMAESVIRLIGITQTIPSIALLGFMVPLFGVGVLPAVVALWIYSLFPILRNTYTGVRDADPEAAAAAEALGMTPTQVRNLVRVPLAAPVIMAGIRTAAVITVGTATLAAFIGGGGLGVPIVSGLQMADSSVILSGALPAAILALVVDGILAVVERQLRPRGLRIKL